VFRGAHPSRYPSNMGMASNLQDATIDAMNLTINGDPQSSSAETLAALVDQLGMKPDRVAIELNREIVPRDRWLETPLRDGDRLEIVHFVGGGSCPAMNCYPKQRGEVASLP